MYDKSGACRLKNKNFNGYLQPNKTTGFPANFQSIMIKKLLISVVILAVLYVAAIFYLESRDPLIKWDWSKIDTSKKHFPKDFIWGVATSAHQIEGGHQNINSFGWWEQQKKANGEPTIENGDLSGDACDNWNLYLEDIKLMQRLHVNSYRFSVSWSKIMPEKGVVDTAALQHYKIMCDSLVAVGIEPMVTLQHVTVPMWFYRMGAFEKEENIRYFVDFTKVVYMALHDKVKYWGTINEPSVYMFDSYFSGNYAPGVSDPQLAAKVLFNMMKAHVAIYKLFKTLPGGEKSEIGLVKNMMQLDAYRKWNILDQFIKFNADNVYNEVLLRLFKTGKYKFYMPGFVDFEGEIPDAPKTLDYIGLNYYSHYAFKFTGNLEESLEPLPYPGEPMTDMDYTIYPEGIYRAIKRIAKLDVPIIITENGIADAKDDRRAQFIDRSLYAVSKAIEDGYDVRGYYYWSLMDNFEWNLGYGKRFGLYEVDFKTKKRTLREGAKEYIRIIDENTGK
jgi:beta-glucosidase